MVDHPNIKSATSVLDYVFRVLAYEYLDRDDLVHVVDEDRLRPNNNVQQELSQVRVTAPQHKTAAKELKLAPSKPVVAAKVNVTAETKKLMGTSADAPACSNCGNITLRNGTCYMCPNCGTTTGCS